MVWINSSHAHGRLSLFQQFASIIHIFGFSFYITQSYKVNALAALFQYPQIREIDLLLHFQIHTLNRSMTIMGPFSTWDNGYINHICLVHNFNCNSSSIWYLSQNKILGTNFWVKFAYFDLLLSPLCLVGEMCNMTNCIIMGITEKLFPFL